ncbi:hypothetical protein [Selenihalanaerobacter shriftii]|uniref:Uncharacterized protein n=1 Tax=Selenihalanaerobacter shriftii TaxID=142842 RepID=A0A1T4NF96_9FIRM|nr:hypothetical protein [Selenihalanaerobacter shriftii]SJZ77468.1 hypothetical protein SAMN02745118_01780 [Selenihalanaerobacter shriftii]
MATLTAQILVGGSHPNQGGINPSHYLFLSENSRPAWMLMPENIFSEEKEENKIVWIPTLENILEDALLMIGIYVLKDEELCKLAEEYFDDFETDHIELYEDISEENRNKLYKKCRELEQNYKIVITSFDGDRFGNQLKVLEEYDIDVSVCTPKYTRHYSQWQDKVR